MLYAEKVLLRCQVKRIVITEKGAGLKEQIAKDVVHLEETLMLEFLKMI